MPSQGAKGANEANDSLRSSGKTKSKAKRSRKVSGSMVPDLVQEDLDGAIANVSLLSRIFSFTEAFRGEIGDIDSIYGFGMRQQERIKQLQATVAELLHQRDEEYVRLQEENDAYRDDSYQHERSRKDLEQKMATMQSQMDMQKEVDITEAKREITDESKADLRRFKEAHRKKMEELEVENNKSKETIKRFKEERKLTSERFDQQKKSSDLHTRSFQTRIEHLESELHQINVLSEVSPQTPKYYVDGFHDLEEMIRDVAVNHLVYLPEDAKSLDSTAVRGELSKASKIFKYPLLSAQRPASTFLRECATRNFLSMKLTRLVQRLYFTEETPTGKRGSGSHPPDRILDTLSNVTGRSVKQERAWRLATVEKLDRIRTQGENSTKSISTMPDQADIVQAIEEQLHYFQNPADQRLHSRLTEIAKHAIKLWSALRKDSCQLHFGYDPGAKQSSEWPFIDHQATDDAEAEAVPTQISPTQLPLKPFVLFPRITGSFDSDTSPRELHPGLALSHESPAFRESFQEIIVFKQMTAEWERSLRSGSSAKSSPVMAKSQANWPGPQNGLNHRKQESLSNVEAGA